MTLNDNLPPRRIYFHLPDDTIGSVFGAPLPQGAVEIDLDEWLRRRSDLARAFFDTAWSGLPDDSEED